MDLSFSRLVSPSQKDMARWTACAVRAGRQRKGEGGEELRAPSPAPGDHDNIKADEFASWGYIWNPEPASDAHV